MKKAIVIEFKCPQDHPCPAVPICPVDAISQKGYAAPFVNQKTCIGCGKCIDICPTGAFQFKD